MYWIDDKDSVSELTDMPPIDAGAPLPVVLSDEDTLVVAYIISEPDPDWDGSYATSVSPESADQPIALVRFDMPRCHMFGPPNDEAFNGHPLYKRGLRHYSAWEVSNSSWIRQLLTLNSVHPRHRKEMFDSDRHFILAFHDSTFECVAKGYDARVCRGSMRSIIGTMAAMLDGTTPPVRGDAE